MIFSISHLDNPNVTENYIPIMKKYNRTNPKNITVYFKEGRSSPSEGTA